MSQFIRLSLTAVLMQNVGGILTIPDSPLNMAESNVSDTIAGGYRTCHPNSQPKLVPPEGTMWMGGIMNDKEHWPALFRKAGLSTPPMQVFRMYSDIRRVGQWKTMYYTGVIEDAKKRGDILWFDVTAYDWMHCSRGWCDKQFKALADILVSIKPAQAFVSLGHEVDHTWPGVKGSSQEFVAMWQRAHNLITRHGGTNAVWKYVLSNQIWDAKHMYENCWQQALDRWPGDRYVDWLGHNLYMKFAKDDGNGSATYAYGETFFTTKRGNSVKYVLNSICEKLKQASRDNRQFMQKPWALSTVGVHDPTYSVGFEDVLGNENLGVPNEFRIEFFSELAETLKNPGKYKMFAYFDCDDCKLDAVTVKPFHGFAARHIFDGC